MAWFSRNLLFFFFFLNCLHNDLVGTVSECIETSIAGGVAQDGTHAVRLTMGYTNIQVCINLRAMTLKQTWE